MAVRRGIERDDFSLLDEILIVGLETGDLEVRDRRGLILDRCARAHSSAVWNISKIGFGFLDAPPTVPISRHPDAPDASLGLGPGRLQFATSCAGGTVRVWDLSVHFLRPAEVAAMPRSGRGPRRDRVRVNLTPVVGMDVAKLSLGSGPLGLASDGRFHRQGTFGAGSDIHALAPIGDARQRLLCGDFSGCVKLLDWRTVRTHKVSAGLKHEESGSSGTCTSEIKGSVQYIGRHTGPVWDMLFLPRFSLAASCGLDASVRLWNADRGYAAIRVASPFAEGEGGHHHSRSVLAMASEESTRAFFDGGEALGGSVSPSSASLLSTGDDCTLVVWSLPDLKKELSYEHIHPIKSLTLLPRRPGYFLFGDSRGGAYVGDLRMLRGPAESEAESKKKNKLRDELPFQRVLTGLADALYSYYRCVAVGSKSVGAVYESVCCNDHGWIFWETFDGAAKTSISTSMMEVKSVNCIAMGNAGRWAIAKERSDCLLLEDPDTPVLVRLQEERERTEREAFFLDPDNDLHDFRIAKADEGKGSELVVYKSLMLDSPVVLRTLEDDESAGAVVLKKDSAVELALVDEEVLLRCLAGFDGCTPPFDRRSIHYFLLFRDLEMTNRVSALLREMFNTRIASWHLPLLCETFVRSIEMLEMDDDSDSEDDEDDMSPIQLRSSFAVAAYGCLRTFRNKIPEDSEDSHQKKAKRLLKRIDYEDAGKKLLKLNSAPISSFKEASAALLSQHLWREGSVLRPSVKLVVPGFAPSEGVLPAHVELLVLHSSFFLRMLRFGGKESSDFATEGKMTLSVLPVPGAVRLLLQHIYTGQLSMGTKDLHSSGPKRRGKKVEIPPPLKPAFFWVLVLADMYNALSLRRAALEAIVDAIVSMFGRIRRKRWTPGIPASSIDDKLPQGEELAQLVSSAGTFNLPEDKLTQEAEEEGESARKGSGTASTFGPSREMIIREIARVAQLRCETRRLGKVVHDALLSAIGVEVPSTK